MRQSVTLHISTELLAVIAKDARDKYPEECCGVLLGTMCSDSVRQVLQVIPVKNTNEDHRERMYLISSERIRDIEIHATQIGFEVLGFYHSHPDHKGEPSDFDRKAAWPWYSYIIVPVWAGKPSTIRSWRLTDDRSRFNEEQIIEDKNERNDLHPYSPS